MRWVKIAFITICWPFTFAFFCFLMWLVYGHDTQAPFLFIRLIERYGRFIVGILFFIGAPLMLAIDSVIRAILKSLIWNKK